VAKGTSTEKAKVGSKECTTDLTQTQVTSILSGTGLGLQGFACRPDFE
jgi:hypothetical protein